MIRPVFRALDPGYQALREETVHSDTDRAWRQIDDRAYRIHGQGPFVQQDFQHAEIREAKAGLFYPRLRTLSRRASPSSLPARCGPSR